MSQNLLDQPDILRTLKALNDFFKREKLSYCVIGGIAVQLRGRPRFTHDIDICVMAPLADQELLISKLASTFTPRFPDAMQLARSAQIMPVKVKGVDVDIALGMSGFEQRVLARAQLEVLADDVSIPVCSAEDLIVYKCVAGRPQDIEDVRLVVKRNSEKLDCAYIRQTLREFEEALASDEFVTLFNRFAT